MSYLARRAHFGDPGKIGAGAGGFKGAWVPSTGLVTPGPVTDAEGGKGSGVTGVDPSPAWLETPPEPLVGVKADRVAVPPGDAGLEASGIVRTFFTLILLAIDAVEIVATEPITMNTIVKDISGRMDVDVETLRGLEGVWKVSPA